MNVEVYILSTSDQSEVVQWKVVLYRPRSLADLIGSVGFVVSFGLCAKLPKRKTCNAFFLV